jgi:hypothetical protein
MAKLFVYANVALRRQDKSGERNESIKHVLLVCPPLTEGKEARWVPETWDCEDSE